MIFFGAVRLVKHSRNKNGISWKKLQCSTVGRRSDRFLALILWALIGFLMKSQCKGIWILVSKSFGVRTSFCNLGRKACDRVRSWMCQRILTSCPYLTWFSWNLGSSAIGQGSWCRERTKETKSGGYHCRYQQIGPRVAIGTNGGFRGTDTDHRLFCN